MGGTAVVKCGRKPLPKSEWIRRAQLGKLIQAFRLSKRMSQGEFALKIGRSQDVISRWELGASGEADLEAIREAFPDFPE